MLIGIAGDLTPQKLSAAHVMDADAFIKTQGYARVTVNNKSARLRRLLRWLWEYHGAPKLDELVTRHPGTRPRNVVATDEERERLLVGLPKHLKLLLLLCSDLAIRSGTAVKLSADNYDEREGALEFTTKMGERLRLPVTREISELIEECDLGIRMPFVYQMWQKIKKAGPESTGKAPTHPFSLQFAKARRELGITRKLTFHDTRNLLKLADALSFIEVSRDC